jgi:tRNA modification GTPase
MNKTEPIVAVATAPGRGGIGVVRLSGPDLRRLMTGLIGRHLSARRAQLADFRGSQGEVIDRGIALYFPAPHSYTGEDVLELQGHGGTVVMQLLVKRCLELGARLAEPGEFTRRSYLNGKIDLAQAEAVADLIDANTAQAARHAMRSLQGVYSTRVKELIRELTELRVLIEAALDFPEEEIDFVKRSDAEGRLAHLLQQLEEVLAASRQGRLLRDGMHVALAGQPNVGKSSLLNQLAGEDLAIVTAVPGTTRDAIRMSVDLDGVPVHIIDTAGLRAADDPVEQIGIARAWAAIERADVVLLMVDATVGETDAERAILGRLPPQVPYLRVMNKIDLAGHAPAVAREGTCVTVSVSALTGAGMDLLRNALLELSGWRGGEEGLFLARARHVEALDRAQAHLQQALEVSARLELLAEELRLAQQALGTITGQCSSDELLGEIFARFCIGK